MVGKIDIRKAKQLVEDLNYSNYKYNRERSPEISVDRWVEIYGSAAVDRYEARYQQELSKKDYVCPELVEAKNLVDDFVDKAGKFISKQKKRS